MDKFNATCPNCGANNDVIQKSCLFCKTLLNPASLDLFTTEELLDKTQEWINRLTDKVLVDDPNSRGFQKVLYGGKKRLKISQIYGIIDDYMFVIKDRARNTSIYNDRISYIEKKKSSMWFKARQSESQLDLIEKIPMLIGVIILAIISGILRKCLY